MPKSARLVKFDCPLKLRLAVNLEITTEQYEEQQIFGGESDSYCVRNKHSFACTKRELPV